MTSDPIAFSNENIVFDDSKELDDPQVSDGLKVISNESMDFNDPKEFDDPKGISIGSMNFDNPKVYGDTSIFDGLVSYLELFLPQLYLNGGFKGGETTFKLHFRDSGEDVRQRQRQ